MSIRSSASHEVRRLIGDLEGPDAVKREAASARLAIIGTRAVRQILERLAAGGDPSVRASLLQSLEAIPDPRAIDPVLTALSAPEPEIRQAATRAAKGLLPLPQSTRLLDRLTAELIG